MLTLSGREVVKIFEKLGWEVARQRVSHIVMVKEGEIATLSIPDHIRGGQGYASEFDPVSWINDGRIRAYSEASIVGVGRAG